MWSNNKLLISFTFLAIISGFSLLWFGFMPVRPVDTPAPVLQVKASLIPAPDVATASAVVGVEGERAMVAKVVDGDTINLSDGRTVRFIGIDTPETVDPRRPVGCFGKEASNEVKNLLSGKEIILQKDVSDTDKYGRILRYIYLPLDVGQALFVNDYLVREGFAKVYTYPPDVKFNEQFRQAEVQAKKESRGLWGKC